MEFKEIKQYLNKLLAVFILEFNSTWGISVWLCLRQSIETMEDNLLEKNGLNKQQRPDQSIETMQDNLLKKMV